MNTFSPGAETQTKPSEWTQSLGLNFDKLNSLMFFYQPYKNHLTFNSDFSLNVNIKINDIPVLNFEFFIIFRLKRQKKNFVPELSLQ